MEIERRHDIYKRKRLFALLTLLALLVAVSFISLSIGAVFISPFSIFKKLNLDILSLRLSRIVLGIVVGASLSVAGCILQGLLRNPLAEPYLLGISSGAGLGAVIAIVMGMGGTYFGINSLPFISFIGTILTMILVYNLAKIGGRIPVQSLILAGVIVGSVFSSILLFLISLSQNQMVHDAIWWLLGNLQIYDMKLLILVGLISIIGIIIASFFSRELNIIALGEDEAIHLGINIEALKKILFIVASLITAASVSACGIIGFVGLIIPHMMRLIIGPDHRILIPSSALLGGIFLVLCDTLARTIILPAEIPIGAITALIGGPFFIFLLRTKRKITFR